MALEHNAGLVQTLLSQRSWAPRRAPRGLRCSPLSIGVSPGVTAAPKQPSSSSPVLMSLWWLSVLPGVKSSLPLGPASSREVPEVGYGDESPRAGNPSASTCSPAGTGFWYNSCRGSPCGTGRGVAMTRGAQRGKSIPVAVPAAGQDAGDTARGCVRSWWWFGGAEPGWPLGRDFPLCMLEMFSKLPAGPAEPGLSSF